jgi:hypothetical protein
MYDMSPEAACQGGHIYVYDNMSCFHFVVQTLHVKVVCGHVLCPTTVGISA